VEVWVLSHVFYYQDLLTEHRIRFSHGVQWQLTFFGSLLIGFFIELFSRSLIPENLRSFLIIGFLGAFTTFSAYAMESIDLLRGNEIKFFFQNVLIHNMLGLVCVIFGIYLSRIVIKIFTPGIA